MIYFLSDSLIGKAGIIAEARYFVQEDGELNRSVIENSTLYYSKIGSGYDVSQSLLIASFIGCTFGNRCNCFTGAQITVEMYRVGTSCNQHPPECLLWLFLVSHADWSSCLATELCKWICGKRFLCCSTLLFNTTVIVH